MEHSFLQRLNSKRAGIIPIIIVAATLTSKYNIECSFSALMLHCVSALTKIPFLIRYVQCMVLSPPTTPPGPSRAKIGVHLYLLAAPADPQLPLCYGQTFSFITEMNLREKYSTLVSFKWDKFEMMVTPGARKSPLSRNSRVFSHSDHHKGWNILFFNVLTQSELGIIPIIIVAATLILKI